MPMGDIGLRDIGLRVLHDGKRLRRGASLRLRLECQAGERLDTLE